MRLRLRSLGSLQHSRLLFLGITEANPISEAVKIQLTLPRCVRIADELRQKNSCDHSFLPWPCSPKEMEMMETAPALGHPQPHRGSGALLGGEGSRPASTAVRDPGPLGPVPRSPEPGAARGW